MSLIVADIGGTNARFAFQQNKNSDIELIDNFLCYYLTFIHFSGIL